MEFRNDFDRMVFDRSNTENVYNFPEDMDGLIVLDIGSHIGSSAVSALARGASAVWCYEAHPENAVLLQKNLKEYGDKARAFNKIVWRSDTTVTGLFVTPMGPNTGGMRVTDREEEGATTAPVIGLDEILTEMFNEYGKYPDIIKIDVEGSEFPILITSSLVENVKTIYGEIHAMYPSPEFMRIPQVTGYDFNMYILAKFLKSKGFTINYETTMNEDDLAEAIDRMPAEKQLSLKNKIESAKNDLMENEKTSKNLVDGNAEVLSIDSMVAVESRERFNESEMERQFYPKMEEKQNLFLKVSVTPEDNDSAILAASDHIQFFTATK